MSVSVERVREVLKGRALEVCQILLPTGKEDRGMWKVGDAYGAAGKSCVVHLTGQYAGTWTDFGEAEGAETRSGDLIKLWMVGRRMSFRDALEDIARTFGVRADESGWQRRGGEGPRPKTNELANLPARLRPVLEGGEVWKWLTEKRKLTGEVIRRFKIGEHTGEFRDKTRTFVVFPFYDVDGKLALLKYRDIEDKGCMWTWPRTEEGGKTILFGLQGLRGEGRQECLPHVEGEREKPHVGEAWPNDLFVTEGELDAMALGVYGFGAVSLPFGAQGKRPQGAAAATGSEAAISKAHEKWIENMHDWLEGFETIYLAGDCDEAGRAAWTGIPARLGEWKIRFLQWPGGHKDANDCLVFGVTGREIGKAIAEAKGIDPDELARASEHREEIHRVYYPVTEEDDGDPLPWVFPINFRPGEMTVWHGWNGSGKTQVLNNCLAHWARPGKGACIASLEWPVADTWAFLGKIGLGKRKPTTEQEFGEVVAWLDERFLAYHKLGEARLEDLLRVFGHAARKYGCFHFVVDALLRLAGVKIDDLDAQRQVCNALLDFCQRFRVHVHLVAHSKKPDSRHDPRKCWPSKYDISGSGDLSNLVQNVVCVWRNAGKEEALFEARQFPEGHEEREKAETAWYGKEDTLLVVQKQRKTGREGHKRLWFDKDEHGGSFQFREDVSGMAGVKLMGGERQETVDRRPETGNPRPRFEEGLPL